MVTAYIAVGSNLGERERNIRRAVNYLKQTKGVKLKKLSSLYETEPQGGPRQGKFLNGAIEIETLLSPQELLARLQEIERRLGRKKTVKNGPRTIDLDILLYGNLNIEEENLLIPHPRMEERDFVLMPLREINASYKKH